MAVKNRTPLWLRVVPVYVAIGILIYLPVAFKKVSTANAYAEATKIERSLKRNSTEFVSGKPVNVSIPQLGVNLKVVDGIYDDKSGWNVTPLNAHYAVSTPQPNNSTGKTVIYGHDTKLVFQPTDDIRAGEILYLRTANSLTFSYEYASDETVLPNNTAVFNNTTQGKPRLAIITCSGQFSSTRRIMNFTYRGVAK